MIFSSLMKDPNPNQDDLCCKNCYQMFTAYSESVFVFGQQRKCDAHCSVNSASEREGVRKKGLHCRTKWKNSTPNPQDFAKKNSLSILCRTHPNLPYLIHVRHSWYFPSSSSSDSKGFALFSFSVVLFL